MDDYNKQSGESTGTVASGTSARMKEQVAGKVSEIKEKVSDFGRQAGEKVDNTRQSAADTLDQSAYKLSGAAEYLRKTDLKGMGADLGEVVKRYPGPALAAAAIVGFLVARGLTSKSD
jgi:ElaB/YqjD/DUF883 family membrane-anchored ribosome-binding protein